MGGAECEVTGPISAPSPATSCHRRELGPGRVWYRRVGSRIRGRKHTVERAMRTTQGLKSRQR